MAYSKEKQDDALRTPSKGSCYLKRTLRRAPEHLAAISHLLKFLNF